MFLGPDRWSVGTAELAVHGHGTGEATEWVGAGAVGGQ